VPDLSDQPEPLVQLQIEQLPDRAVVTLVGELDMSNAEDVQRALTDTGIAAGDGGLEVDLTRLGFLDSAGIAALNRLHRAVPGGLRLRAGPDTVAGRTLRLAGMDQVLEIVPEDGPA
jgi:anti-sigma B factor antagonist